MSMRSLGAAQGAPGNVAEPDALSGLIAALSDPKATAAKLQEIKDVLAANEQAIEKLAIGQAEIDAREAESLKTVNALAKREEVAATWEKRLDTRSSALDGRTASVNAASDKVRAEREALNNRLAEINADEAERARSLEERERMLGAVGSDLDARKAALDKREQTIADTEAYLAERVAQFDARLVKLNAALGGV